jgi:hypothetical protein
MESIKPSSHDANAAAFWKLKAPQNTVIWIYQRTQHHTSEDHQLYVLSSEPPNKKAFLITFNPCVSNIMAANLRETTALQAADGNIQVFGDIMVRMVC